MKTKSKTIDFFKPLTLDEIKSKLKATKKGFHDVEFIDGSPIELEHGKLYVTTKMSYRFNLNYAKNNIVRLSSAIYKASTKDDVEACHKIYDLLSKEQRSCVSAKSLRELADKDAKIASGRR